MIDTIKLYSNDYNLIQSVNNVGENYVHIADRFLPGKNQYDFLNNFPTSNSPTQQATCSRKKSQPDMSFININCKEEMPEKNISDSVPEEPQISKKNIKHQNFENYNTEQKSGKCVPKSSGNPLDWLDIAFQSKFQQNPVIRSRKSNSIISTIRAKNSNIHHMIKVEDFNQPTISCCTDTHSEMTDRRKPNMSMLHTRPSYEQFPTLKTSPINQVPHSPASSDTTLETNTCSSFCHPSSQPDRIQLDSPLSSAEESPRESMFDIGKISAPTFGCIGSHLSSPKGKVTSEDEEKWKKFIEQNGPVTNANSNENVNIGSESDISTDKELSEINWKLMFDSHIIPLQDSVGMINPATKNIWGNASNHSNSVRFSSLPSSPVRSPVHYNHESPLMNGPVTLSANITSPQSVHTDYDQADLCEGLGSLSVKENGISSHQPALFRSIWNTLESPNPHSNYDIEDKMLGPYSIEEDDYYSPVGHVNQLQALSRQMNMMDSGKMQSPLSSQNVNQAKVQSQLERLLMSYNSNMQSNQQPSNVHIPKPASHFSNGDINRAPQPNSEITLVLPDGTSANICKYFVKGNCMRGLKCSFAHLDMNQVPAPQHPVNQSPLMYGANFGNAPVNHQYRNGYEMHSHGAPLPYMQNGYMMMPNEGHSEYSPTMGNMGNQSNLNYGISSPGHPQYANSPAQYSMASNYPSIHQSSTAELLAAANRSVNLNPQWQPAVGANNPQYIRAQQQNTADNRSHSRIATNGTIGSEQRKTVTTISNHSSNSGDISSAGKKVRRETGDASAKFNNLPVSQLKGQVFAICKDQHGCRFLQKKLEERNYEFLDIIYDEIFENFVELMTDPFGNYLCQKMLEYCSEERRSAVVDKVCPDLVNISLNMHGTRAVQKLIDYITDVNQINRIIAALRDSVVVLIKDLNGNHVIQRCLNKLSAAKNQFIYDAVTNHCVEVATHRHGCCVLQRCVDHASGSQKFQLVDEITQNALDLVQDPFGNYVVQYVLDLENEDFIAGIVARFYGSICLLSMQKFSSNVIEKCIRVTNARMCKKLIEELIDEDHLENLLRDSYGNYVVQTALDVADAKTKEKLVEHIRPLLPSIRNTPYGKRIQSKLYREQYGQQSYAATVVKGRN